jgi:glycosyltransferase involved in cell wall biosynthesis
MIKVTTIQNIIVPYEVPLFTELSRSPEIDLNVYFCDTTYKDRKWDISECSQYKNEVLPGITIELGEVASSLNPGIINRLRRDGPDVIILSGGYSNLTMLLAFIYGSLSGTPVIYRCDGTKYDRMKSSMISRASRPVERYVITRSQALICPGNDAREYLIDSGATPERVFISPYTTQDDDLFIRKSIEFRENKAQIKAQLGIKEKIILIFVGRFIGDKGIEYLMDAFRRLSKEHSNIGLLLLGDGPMDLQLRDYCKDYGLNNVYFPGFVDGQDKVKYYTISDIFVLPTLRDLWGLVINEAMLCGLPVITTRATGAARDMVINGKNGFVVEEASSDDLYLALETAISDDELRSEMGRCAMETVSSRFNMARRREGFINAIKYACARKGDGSADT